MAKNKIGKKWWVAIIPGIIAIVIIVFIIALLVIKLLWGWVVPDLFPGAVSLGLIAGTISWYTAFKVAIVMALLSGMFKAKNFRSRCNCECEH